MTVSRGAIINNDGIATHNPIYINGVIWMNWFDGTAMNTVAFNEAFDVAGIGRDILNKVYAIINNEQERHIDEYQEIDVIYRDFRIGNIQHISDNILKALSASSVGHP